MMLMISIIGLSVQAQITNVDGIYYRLTYLFERADGSEPAAIVTTMGDTDYYKGEVSIPPTVIIGGAEYPVTAISDMAFKGCKQLTSIRIPSSITRIPSGAFWGCENLSSIVIDTENKVYDSRNACNAVIETATNTLIAGCEKSAIPSSVTTVGQCAFSGFSGITSLNMPANVTEIQNYAFLDCNAIETLYWNSSCPIAIIYPLSSSIKRVVLGDSVTSISNGLFAGWSNLESVFIPASVTEISPNAFSNCGKLLSITVDPQNPVYDSRDNSNAIIETGNNRLIVACKGTVIPSSVKVIGNYAFANCSWLTTLKIPASIETIESSAFRGCTNLTSIELPSNLTSIGSYAFSGCTNLRSISIPSSIKELEEGLFSHCDSLTDVVIPSGLEIIGDHVFEYCPSLRSIVLPEGLKNIGNSSFVCCGFSHISIPSSVKEIGNNAFGGCYGILTAGPKGGGYDYEFCWDTIPANAFSGLRSLESVYIPKTVKAIYECNAQRYKDNLGYRGVVFDNYLGSLSVSFKDTKLMRYLLNEETGYSRYIESDMDYNLYYYYGVFNLTILDDSIKSLYNCLNENVREVTISKDTKFVSSEAFGFTPHNISYKYSSYYYGMYVYSTRTIRMASNVENIFVENGNESYTSNDGVLFNKDRSELIAYPAGRKGEYRIPSTTTKLGDKSFRNCDGLDRVTITKNIELIGEKAFEGSDSLIEVTIEGSPEISLNAFANCNKIQGVWTRNAVPGLMNIFNTPQTIITGDYGSITGDEVQLTPINDKELEREITEIHTMNYLGWTCKVLSPEIMEGNYKISIGILPSPDGLPNYFHPVIYGINDTASVVLYESIDTELVEYRPGKYRKILTPIYLTNDITGYDRIVLADTLTLPTGYSKIAVAIESGLNERNLEYYSRNMYIDRVFIEPLDRDIPIESYAGTFTKKVFNESTLYVPDGSIDTYKAADGWKLFKNIQANTRSYPADEVEVTISNAGYATFYYSDGDYVLPKGLSAKVVCGIWDDQLVYKTIASGDDEGVIPAGVPVLISSEDKKPGVYRLPLASRKYENTEYNLLRGSDIDTQTFSEYSDFCDFCFYKLAYGPAGTDLSDVVGWYWGAADGGAFSIEGHKAWLALPKASTKGIAGFSLAGDATFIPETDTDDNQSQKVIYDLYGRKLSAPTGSGIYIIDGKKVIVTE